MEVLIVLVVLVLLAVVVVAAAKKSAGSRAATLPYQAAGTLFSAAERSFLGVLDQAVGSEYRIFGKVRVADVASLKAGLSNSARQIALNRIALKHFDFVVCRANDLSVVCVVELNDKSHSSQRAQARDEFIAKVCEAIRLPLLTIQAKRAYSAQEVQAQFASLMSSAPDAASNAAQST